MLEKKFDLKVPNYEDLSLLEEKEANLWRKSFFFNKNNNYGLSNLQDFIKIGYLDGLFKFLKRNGTTDKAFEASEFVYFVNLFFF